MYCMHSMFCPLHYNIYSIVSGGIWKGKLPVDDRLYCHPLQFCSIYVVFNVDTAIGQHSSQTFSMSNKDVSAHKIPMDNA